MLQSQSKSRLVGANSPGMISVTHNCRIGFYPLICLPGAAGIVAKSGTLSYEAIASTTRAGVGQSLVIGMGGDPLPGTDFVDALKVFEHDEATQGIIIIGELGGTAEEEAAEWIKNYRKRSTDPKFASYLKRCNDVLTAFKANPCASSRYRSSLQTYHGPCWCFYHARWL